MNSTFSIIKPFSLVCFNVKSSHILRSDDDDEVGEKIVCKLNANYQFWKFSFSKFSLRRLEWNDFESDCLIHSSFFNFQSIKLKNFFIKNRFKDWLFYGVRLEGLYRWNRPFCQVVVKEIPDLQSAQFYLKLRQVGSSKSLKHSTEKSWKLKQTEKPLNWLRSMEEL